MGKSPRYMTYKAGELEATLHELTSFADARAGAVPVPIRSDPQGRRFGSGASRDGTISETGRSATGLITAHSCPVTYPDGGTGVCRYTRAGPAWHVFRFEHTGKRNGKTAPLPVYNETERIPNTIAAIEETAQRLASRAFSAAARQEQRDYFGRATPPFHQKAEGGQHPQMKTKEAKEASGKYALCIRVGRSLLPTGGTWNTLDEAVAAWEVKDAEKLARGDLSVNLLIIGCCCRWKRRWQEPLYNPLHAHPGYLPPLACPSDESGQDKAIKAEETPLVIATARSEEDAEAEWEEAGADEEPEDTGEMPLPPGDADAPIDQPDAAPDPFFEGINTP